MKSLLGLLLLLLATPVFAGEELHIFNWNDYMSEEVVAGFEKNCNCKVVQDYYSGTEEMMAKLLAGASGYDLVVPTQNAVQALIQQGFLEKLDKGALPNIKNLDPGFLNRSYDPGNVYSLPYAYTTTLIGFNEHRLQEQGIKPISWAVIFDPQILEKIKGKVTVMDDADELFGAALKYLGYSVNDVDEKHLREAQQVIMKAKPYWAAFNSSSYIKELTVGSVWVAHGYSSDMVQARNDALEAKRDFTVNFILPKEGAVLALDNVVIPKEAKNKKLALQFIDFLMDGKNAAGLSNDVGAGNPNAAALPFINPELKQLTAIFPDQKVLATLETLEATSAKVRRLKNKLWTEIKLK
ncbi:MAG: spermidine/putrescine ABC transporter substrate-binding protein [Desulfocapsaceae bacterium]|nr:spermidine/putrescine ABC transporter substrate-binding protein [Desulfocapsaceae bacterium]